MEVPHFTTTTIDGRRVLVDDSITPECQSVTLDSTNVDTGTPTHRFRPGNVVGRRASTGRYVEANDANVDVAIPPSITSAGHTDGNGVIKLTGNHGTISVTTTTGSGTEANNVTDLNANAVFAAHYVASVSGTDLKIEARGAGKEEWFYMHSDTMATAAFAEGVDNGSNGEDGLYGVTLEYADLKDDEGTAVHAECLVAFKGHFDASNLINLTAQARAALKKQGAKFDDE